MQLVRFSLPSFSSIFDRRKLLTEPSVEDFKAKRRRRNRPQTRCPYAEGRYCTSLVMQTVLEVFWTCVPSRLSTPLSWPY